MRRVESVSVVWVAGGISLLAGLALATAPGARADEPAADPAGQAATRAPLGLEQAVSEAVAHSPAVLQASAQAEAASWRGLEALSAHLPQLSVAGEHFFSAQYSNLNVNFGGASINFPSAFPRSTVSLDASLMVFDGLVAIDRYRAARLEGEAARHAAARARFQAEEEVRLRYEQALAAQILLATSEANIKSLRDHLDLAQAMVRSGYSTRFDMLRIQAQLEEAEAERLLAVDNVTIARRELARAMGLPEDARPLTGELPVPDAKRVDERLKLDLSEREDLRALEAREEASHRGASAASRFWVPKVSLFAQKLFYEYGSFDPVVNETNGFQGAYSLGVRLSWNLFDGGASLAKSREAAFENEAGRQGLRAALLAAPEEFDTWKRRFLYNVTLYHARKRAVEESEESVRLARAGLRAGTRTNTEWLDAELELFRSRAGLVRAQADAVEARMRLEMALGHRL